MSTCDPFTIEGVQNSFTDTCELVRVRQSYAGEYACEASIGESTMRDNVTVSVSG